VRPVKSTVTTGLTETLYFSGKRARSGSLAYIQCYASSLHASYAVVGQQLGQWRSREEYRSRISLLLEVEEEDNTLNLNPTTKKFESATYVYGENGP
jgi:hypothetical protein